MATKVLHRLAQRCAVSPVSSPGALASTLTASSNAGSRCCVARSCSTTRRTYISTRTRTTTAMGARAVTCASSLARTGSRHCAGHLAPQGSAWIRGFPARSYATTSSGSEGRCLGRWQGQARGLRQMNHGLRGQSRTYKTVEEAKSRYRSGPFSWKAGIVFLLSGAGLVWYFNHEKERMQRKRIADATKGIGKPKVGGPFELVDEHGQPFSSEDMKGKYSIVYFGFTHCPDICPEELDKLARAIDLISASRLALPLVPIFITCDPARDTPAVLQAYLGEFHTALRGLTGTWEQIKDVCKKYRVYFSTPEGVQPGQDYLVDHSIYFYLMDPEGDFVEAIGRQHSPEEAARIVIEHMGDWRAGRRERS